MNDRSPFGMRLYRLLWARHLRLDKPDRELRADLVRTADVPESMLDALITDGAAPTPDLVERLAPALGIHTADLFVLAGLPVPLAEAAAGPMRYVDVGTLVSAATPLGADRRAHLTELVRSLPVEPRTESRRTDDYLEGPGALLLRLLANRNIQPWRAAALLRVLGGGPYVSRSTIAQLGPGRVVVTPQYVTAFAHVLGYHPGDMVALIGLGPVFAEAVVHPAAGELAALAWDARRLTADQLSQVLEAAKEKPGSSVVWLRSLT